MNLKRAALMALVALSLTAHAAMATHTSSGLTSSLLGRGTWDRADLAALASEQGPLHRMPASDVAIVRATLAAGGTTDWHGHPGPSAVVVTAGSIRVVQSLPGGACSTTDYAAGTSFFHSEAAHTFINPGSVSAEFYVVYFAPAGGLLVHDPNPGC